MDLIMQLHLNGVQHKKFYSINYGVDTISGNPSFLYSKPIK